MVLSGVAVGWLYINSFETVLRSNEVAEVPSPENTVLAVIPDDVEVASKLAEKVRLLCLVPTTRDKHKEEASSVKNTWGKHCNKILFVTNETDDHINSSFAITYNPTTKDEPAWLKLKYALHHIYDNYYDEFDWVLKCEQNDYVIVENVRYMLYNVSTEEPNVVARCSSSTKIDDHSAFVLNKEAMRKLVDDAFTAGTSCSRDQNIENQYTKISECLASVEVNFVKSQDRTGKERFLKDNIQETINALKSYNDFRTDISNFTAVWPKANPHDLYVYNFFIYEMRSYGAPQEQPPL